MVVGGLDTREHGPAELAAVAGSLFQDPETQVVMGTVRAELAFPLENRGWRAAAVARGVEEAALALGIAGLLDRSTHELSGGELQRVALGAALAGRPRLVLLDEPTSQLDPVAGDELLGVLRRLNEEWGTAVVLAEHRLERCLAAADRVVALRRRRASLCDADPARLPRPGPPQRRPADAGRAALPARRPARRRPSPSRTPARTLRARGLAGATTPSDAGSAAHDGAAAPRRAPAGAAPALRVRAGVARDPATGRRVLRGVVARGSRPGSGSR